MKGLLKGLATTLSTAMRKPVTVQYPDERHPLPVRQRSFPVLTWDFDHDEPFCTGCMVCVRNCPVDCMTAVMHDNPKYATGESNRRKIIEKFWIDYGRCMRCNICVEVCNFEAIVMDNTWTGHEHGAFDRRDLHMDVDELLKPSRTKRLINPFRPQDDLERLEKTLAGEEPTTPGMQGARLDAMHAQEERLAQGLPAGIKEREVEAPKVAAPSAAAAAGAAGAEAGEVLSESKIRAKRMRAEREAKEFTDRGEAVPQEVLDRIALYRDMKPGEAAPAGGLTAGGGGAATGEVLTGTNSDGSMRFPPGVGDGPKGDPNSAEKVRARRMRAERQFKELSAAGEPIPDEMAKTLYDTGSDLAPGGSIWASLAGQGGGGAAAPVAGAAGGAAAAGVWTPPPGVEVGGKGEANSAEKLRAKRMRAERQAREALAAGEPIPDDIVATIKELGGTVPEKAG